MENLVFHKVIGRGSYGTVWKCQCKATGRLFAVKEYTGSKDHANNITTELLPLLTLNHDNIVKVFKWTVERATLYGVFELLDHDVSQELRKSSGGLDSTVIQQYSYQILRAVEFLHSVNIVHRDIKPDNVLVSKSGVIKLADLGLSEKADAVLTRLRWVGTLPFMAPELYLRDCDGYKHCDVWAVGCTVLAMARGKVLFNTGSVLDNFSEIVSTIGPLTPRQKTQFNHLAPGMRLPEAQTQTVLTEKYMVQDQHLAEVIEGCLQMCPLKRASCEQLLNYDYFTNDQFNESFLIELKTMVRRDRHKVIKKKPWWTKLQPQCLTPQRQSDSDHSPKVSSPEKIAHHVVEASNEIEKLEGKKDGENEKRQQSASQLSITNIPKVSSPEQIADHVVMVEPAVVIDLEASNEIEIVEEKQDGQKEEGAGLRPQCLPAGQQSASNLPIINTPKVSSPEQIAKPVVTVNPAVLVDLEEINEIVILEGEQDGEKEEGAVSEEHPAKEEVKRKRGFKAAIRRTLSAIRRRFSIGRTPP